MNITLSQYVFGIKLLYEGLSINPKLPSHIKEADVETIYNDTKYVIHVVNKGHKNKFPTLLVNGEKIEGHVVSFNEKIVNVTCIFE